MRQWRMEARRLRDGRVMLIITPLYEFIPPAYDEFDRFIGFLAEATEMLWHAKDEFSVRMGIALEETYSLQDELSLIRYDVLGVPRHQNPHTGEFHGTTEVKRTSTAWDDMPKIEAELLPDGRLTLTLGRGELDIFANSIDVAIEGLGAKESKSGREEFRIRTSMTPEEAEAFRDELRRLDREVQGGGATHG